MSLLASASPWNDNSNKKRISTIRKTLKKKPVDNDESEIDMEVPLQEKELRPSSFEEDATYS